MSHKSHISDDTATMATTPDVVRLTAILEAELRTHRQPAIRMHYVIVAWCVIVPFALWRFWESASEARWAAACGWVTLLGLSTQLYRIAQSPAQTRAAQQLARTDNIATVGILAEALEWPDTNTRNCAILALTRLLPRLEAGDGARLNARQRACLYRLLQLQNAARNKDLLLAILTAVEQIGDEMALNPVRQLKDGQPATAAQAEVQRAAARCLPLLQTRIEELQSSRILLRASAPEQTGSDVLLRPAAETGMHDPQHLLRASDSPQSPEVP